MPSRSARADGVRTRDIGRPWRNWSGRRRIVNECNSNFRVGYSGTVCARIAGAACHITNKKLNLEFAFRFRRWLIVQHYALSTHEAYCRIVLSLCRFLGNKAMRDVTPLIIGDFLTLTLPPEWSDDHVSHQLCALRCFFDFLYLGGVVDSVAPRFLRARARVRKLPKTLTQSQIKRLIAATDNARDRALIELFYATGCRVGEVTRIRVELIDFRRRCFPVRAKRKERMVYFGAAAARAIHKYLGRRRSGYLFRDIIPQQKGSLTHTKYVWVGMWRDFGDLVVYGRKHSKQFGSVKTVSRASANAKFRRFLKGVDLMRPERDRPLTRSTLGRIVQEIGRRAKLGMVNPHMLRHSFATHMLERGIDIRALQELLGHSWLSSTQIYTRIADKAVARAFRRFHPR
jgi:site-specific recombinase XerD